MMNTQHKEAVAWVEGEAYQGIRDYDFLKESD